MMSAIEAQQRFDVMVEARRWKATPYHHRAHILGVGVDCAWLLLEVFAEAGLIARFEPELYSSDWHLHRNEERYLAVVESYAARLNTIDETAIQFRDETFHLQMGDIIMFQVGRTFSHSAIVTEWPFIIHAYQPSRIVEEVDVRNTPMSHRPMRVYSYWGTR